jgi:hypothetical protein
MRGPPMTLGNAAAARVRTNFMGELAKHAADLLIIGVN